MVQEVLVECLVCQVCQVQEALEECPVCQAYQECQVDRGHQVWARPFKLQLKKWKLSSDSKVLVSPNQGQCKPTLHVTKMRNMPLISYSNKSQKMKMR